MPRCLPSRFWPADSYKVGISPPSYDKQYVRDYLETLDWNKTAPAPRLPADVIERTSAKYREALEKLTEFRKKQAEAVQAAKLPELK